MNIQYEKVVNLLLLQEQINAAFGEGWSTGVSIEPFIDVDDQIAEHMLVTVHLTSDTISADERSRLNALIAEHDRTQKSSIEIQQELAAQRRAEMLATTLDPDTFSPELRPLIEQVNRIKDELARLSGG